MWMLGTLTPMGLLEFVARLRELSGGKPVGFKLAIGHPGEWFAIAKAMVKSGITPDFVVVDGGEGGTGAAPLEFTNHVGAPLREALLLVHNTLVGLNLRGQIRIGAAGKIVTAFDLTRTIAIGMLPSFNIPSWNARSVIFPESTSSRCNAHIWRPPSMYAA